MERAIEVFAAVNFLAIGLSHVLRPRDWADFFIRLRGWGRAGVFVNGFLSLGVGGLIVAFHNVWRGPAAALTVVGWGLVFKAALSFCAPRVAMRSLERVSAERAREFVAAGLVLLALGGLCVYVALTR